MWIHRLSGSRTLEQSDGAGKDWSGRADLNRGPPAPKAGALPGCATPRLYCSTDSKLLPRTAPRRALATCPAFGANCAKTVGTPVEGTSLLSRSPISATDPPSATGGSLGTHPDAEAVSCG